MFGHASSPHILKHGKQNTKLAQIGGIFEDADFWEIMMLVHVSFKKMYL